MSYFYPQGGGDYSLRLSVSYLSEENITHGITRLGKLHRSRSQRKVNEVVTATRCVRSQPRRWGWTYR